MKEKQKDFKRLQSKTIPPSSDSELCDTSNGTKSGEPGGKIKDDRNDGASLL